MSDSSLQDRFDELDAARALGDLSSAEQGEWERLVKEQGFKPDRELDWLAAGLESHYASDDSKLSESLKEKLVVDSKSFSRTASEPIRVNLWQHPALGWAVAACLICGFFLFERGGESVLTPALARQALLQSPNVWQQDFEGQGDYSDLSGDVIWSDTSQQGFMRLGGLAVNDPSVRQYQLWIVDPERDSVPVDGGVFDIKESSEVVIPIRATLRVDQPVAFVITVEKPGGVVVSKQETVAAIAQK